jgi:hypothetical protein
MKLPMTSLQRSSRFIVVTALALVGLTVKLYAPPPGAGKGKTTAVKITLLDLGGDKIKSDGKGAYIHGTDRVTAVIHDSGQLDLDTTSTSTRRQIALDYSDIVWGLAVTGRVIQA